MNGQKRDQPTPLDAAVVTLVDPARRPMAGTIPQDEYDLDTPWHSHDMHQLQYAFSGMVAVEDEQGNYILPRTLAAWIPAGVVHRTKIHLVRSASVLFHPSMIPDAGDCVRIIHVSPLMREMVMGAMRWPLTAPLDKTGLAYFNAFATLCAEWIHEEAPLRLPTLREPRLEAAAAFTRQNLGACDVQQVCKAAGVSERTLRRRFRAAIGMSWEDYRRRARLLKAAALLNDGRLSIGSIAAEVGFESQSAFARAFKDLTGSSPREYRPS
ncbi:MAG TPA: helix-turn-helix transcriptional regulator [Sphingobium sp.]|uniref:AraC family transcriptional regulator n=1 Tax=Sphingobium sp. TaxID=1912891 RepID=UPI002ED1D373